MKITTAQRLADAVGDYLRIEPALVAARKDGDEVRLIALATQWVAAAEEINLHREVARREILRGVGR